VEAESVTRTALKKEMTVDNGSHPKRKVVSPAEVMRMEELKRPRRGEASYVDVCGKQSRNPLREEEFSEDSEGWRRVERRKKNRKPTVVLNTPAHPVHLMHTGNNREVLFQGKGVPRSRRRKEAILVKVEQGSEWLQVYRKIMEARSSLEGTTEVRRTRAGHILIEFDRTVAVNEAATKLRAALSDTTEVAALVNRMTLQIKNIDPLTSKQELVDDMKTHWETNENV
jgi:hypothetical protein